MKAVTGFWLCLTLGSILAGPALSMQSPEHRDLSWPNWLGAPQPIERGSLNFTTNLSTIYCAFLDAQENNDVQRQIACFEASWGQLGSIWNLEIYRPPNELLPDHFVVMHEITRRLAVFSDNLLKFLKSNKEQNWLENKPIIAMVKHLLATIGSSRCETDKAKQYVADRLSAYQALANQSGRQEHHVMVRDMTLSLQDANICNDVLYQFFAPALYRE